MNLQVSYFTDPLCCWSWGMEPHVDRLLDHYGERCKRQYIMGGMLPSWNQFTDEVNMVSRPIQMGPVWMHAAELTGRPIGHQLWIKDPPASSYPACIAVKTASLQSPGMGVLLFRQLQQAAMAQAKNIGHWPEILAAAEQVAAKQREFDIRAFVQAYQNEEGLAAFREDLATVSKYRIRRFPSLVIEAPGKKSILVSGYRTYEGLLAIIEEAFSSPTPGTKHSENRSFY